MAIDSYSELDPILFEELFDEDPDSPEVTFTRGEHGQAGTAIRRGHIAWDQFSQAFAMLMPYSYIDGGVIVSPEAAAFPTIPFLFAKSVKVRPYSEMGYVDGGAVGEAPPAYKRARIEITYGSAEFDQSPNDPHNDMPGGPSENSTYISHKISIGGEFLTWPGSAAQWTQPADPTVPASRAGGQQQIGVNNVSLSVAIPTIEHHVTFHFCPFPPWLAIRQTVGKVNSYSFCGCPPETMLFLGVEASREITNQGYRAWTLEYKFSERNLNAMNPLFPQGWNHFIRPNGRQAGTAQRLQRRVPAGRTLSKADLVVTNKSGGANLAVVDGKTFPATGAFQIQVGNNVYSVNMQNVAQVNATDKVTLFTIAGGLLADVPPGTPVIEQIQMQLAAGITATQTTITVVSQPPGQFPFPTSGQFAVTVGSETMAATFLSNNGDGTYTLSVIRGANGTLAIASGNGAPVLQTGSGIYELADFQPLFLPGVVIS